MQAIRFEIWTVGMYADVNNYTSLGPSWSFKRSTRKSCENQTTSAKEEARSDESV